ncbi:MAG: NAD(P)/FAD-dependent oxidoreductase [Myxococcaceae bacterium]|nr:NAD(P)/FAD-dependent oxidoreductase [Myxococcaceae bacterium]
MGRHVVIVGGGFGGLAAARALADQPVTVTVVDRQNHHLFQPLLYQVATAGLSPGDIASPIRGLLADAPNVEVRLGEVRGVDLAAKTLALGDGSLGYDTLILASGVGHSYFGHPEWAPHAPGLKSIDDALEIRRRVLLAFERAENTQDAEERKALLTFVVVGAGPTGVELSGAIAELARFTVARDFRAIDPTTAKVVLVEAGPRVLPAFLPHLSQSAQHELTRLGVDVRLDTKVEHVGPEGVRLSTGELRSRTVLWAAGVASEPLSKSLGVELDRMGRVKVGPDLSVPGHPEVMVIGDLACFTTPEGLALPGLAPVALQQGQHAARNVLADVDGRPRARFDYEDKGIMATIGRAAGIAQSGAFTLTGLLGWLAWLFIHLLYLVGFRNRAVVLLQWTWAWFTYQRGARLITGGRGQPPG